MLPCQPDLASQTQPFPLSIHPGSPAAVYDQACCTTRSMGTPGMSLRALPGKGTPHIPEEASCCNYQSLGARLSPPPPMLGAFLGISLTYSRQQEARKPRPWGDLGQSWK